ncbi:MAG TPA: dimethylsulfoniopropionate demethylase [Gammaproteobacteria bacterium]|nr:dimethylsulfoniopropionate demethylase [Gammaproteobacteria bacterium]HIM06433.1 dimethylsulfoniopropionate demethylase [Gammaproteobacteria bacterium]
MSSLALAVSRRNRRTPYTDRIETLGVQGYSIVNHTLLPKAFGRTVEEEYWHLRSSVQLWDVSCQRQVEVRGPEAARLVQMMTPRDLGSAVVGQCIYAPLIDDKAGLINDPVILKRAEDWYWLSIADSDVLLWTKGLALGLGIDVAVTEPDVSPLAVQGPRAEDLVAAVFGDAVRNLAYFRFSLFDFLDRQLVVARSGYSKQGGFEIYLDDSSLGTELWDMLWSAGQGLDVTPGCPNLIERIEGGLLSYGNEMTRSNNPLEINLDRFCALDGETDYIGRPALEDISRDGPVQRIRGVVFDGGPCAACGSPWPVYASDRPVGYVTSAIWSPRLKCNVALGMIQKGFWATGQSVSVHSADGIERSGSVQATPM